MNGSVCSKPLSKFNNAPLFLFECPNRNQKLAAALHKSFPNLREVNSPIRPYQVSRDDRAEDGFPAWTHQTEFAYSSTSNFGYWTGGDNAPEDFEAGDTNYTVTIEAPPSFVDILCIYFVVTDAPFAPGGPRLRLCGTSPQAEWIQARLEIGEVIRCTPYLSPRLFSSPTWMLYHRSEENIGIFPASHSFLAKFPYSLFSDQASPLSLIHPIRTTLLM